MQNSNKYVIAAGVAIGLLMSQAAYQAISAEDNPIKDAMVKYHKAPKGTDSVAKKVAKGMGSKEDIENLLKAYTAMAAAKPEHGDMASWKDKTAALIKATEALRDGKPGAAEQFKTASDCKACHEIHHPKK